MNIIDHIHTVQSQLQAAGSTIGGPIEEAANRLTVLLEPSLRLAFQQMLAQSAADLNDQLDGVAQIEVRLEGGEPVLIGTVTPPALPENMAPQPPSIDTNMTSEQEPDGPVTRFTLRIPDGLKSHVDTAASKEGVSLNTWFVRAASRALATPVHPREGNTLTGWLA